MISCDAVARLYPDGTGLGPVTLTIAGDGPLGVVGPSGCGKSTLLRLLAGLERPTSGAVAGLPERIGYVFQEPRLLPWLTAAENVALPLRLSRTDRDVPSDVADAIAFVGLPPAAASKRPHELSGGMRMRVAIARALVDRPDLLLLDEPCAALDAFAKETLDAELRAMGRSRPRPTVVVTHDVAEAVFLSDRLLLLSGSPGTAAATLDVPFGDERPVTLREDPAFLRFVADVVARFRDSTAAADQAGAIS